MSSLGNDMGHHNGSSLGQEKDSSRVCESSASKESMAEGERKTGCDYLFQKKKGEKKEENLSWQYEFSQREDRLPVLLRYFQAVFEYLMLATGSVILSNGRMMILVFLEYLTPESKMAIDTIVMCVLHFSSKEEQEQMEHMRTHQVPPGLLLH